MQIQVAAAKIGKYATPESGDTLEMIERPHGGLSLVLADGQRSGRGAKAISTLVARKAITLLAEGVRDGAAARAANDYLYTGRNGKVSATLNILSVDLVTQTLVLSRNSHCPIIVQTAPDEQIILDKPSHPVGVYRMTRPDITELPLQNGMLIVVYTDGLLSAGQRRGESLDVPALVAQLYARHVSSEHIAQAVADSLLDEALRLDESRPVDDTSIVVLAVTEQAHDDVRRMQVSLPIPPVLRP
jgi:serine phosphatase RsbU (regulator of sigma subunit)